MADLFDVSVGGVGWHFTSHLIALAALFIACFAIAGYITFRDNSIPGDALKDQDVDVEDIDASTLTLSGNATVSGTINTPMGIIAPTLAAVTVGAGAFSPLNLVSNTYYIVTGTLTASACVLPTGTVGDVIVIEWVSGTQGELAVANGAAVTFTCPSTHSSFELNSSYIKAIASAATNGAALLALEYDFEVADTATDNVLTLTGATDAGPGTGSRLVFTRGATQWRVQGEVSGAGAQTTLALSTAVFS